MTQSVWACALFGVVGVAACGNDAAPKQSGGVVGQAGSANASAGGSAAGATDGHAGGALGGAGASAGGQSAGAAGASAGASGSGGGAGASAGSAGTAGSGGNASGPTLPNRVLLYHFSTLVIDTVPAQLMLLESQLMTWGYEVEDSVNPADISATNLVRFAAVAMINTCFEPFGRGATGDTQTAALEAFVEGGGGLFGTHCASVTFQAADPPSAYNALIGGRGGHGSFDGSSACRTTAQHPTTAMLPATFAFSGNLDNADYLAPDSTVLVMCKWSSGEMKDTAVSWYRTPGKGRVFYTNFGKIATDLSDPMLGQKHILLGLGWVLGR